MTSVPDPVGALATLSLIKDDSCLLPICAMHNLSICRLEAPRQSILNQYNYTYWTFLAIESETTLLLRDGAGLLYILPDKPN